MSRKKIIAAFLMLALTATGIYPCTTFMFKDKNGHVYYGRNFDFPAGPGHVEINLRDQLKTSLIWNGSNEKPFSWKSKFGSITFNQNGREFPYGGMNEAGLVIEQMWLFDTKYPAPDSRAGLTELQWIQYQLDVSSSVEDVIKSDNSVRISSYSKAPIHFLVSDAAGNAAVIEYINGKMNYYTGETLKYRALSNETYNYSLDYKMNKDNGGNKTYPSERINSFDRFCTAAEMAGAYNPANNKPVEYAFDILGKVAQGSHTQWSIVYDVADRKIFYKTNANQTIRQLSFSGFDFAGNAQKLYIDIDKTDNRTDEFKVFNYDLNRKLIEDVWNAIPFLKQNPESDRLAIAGYPLTVKYAGTGN